MVCLKFSKSERLVRHKDIQHVYRDGKRYQTGGMGLRVCRNSLQENRIVFSAARKFGTAVSRNRARRICSEIWRTLYKPLAPRGYDLVFILQPCREESFEVRKQQMGTLLKSAGLLRLP